MKLVLIRSFAIVQQYATCFSIWVTLLFCDLTCTQTHKHQWHGMKRVTVTLNFQIPMNALRACTIAMPTQCVAIPMELLPAHVHSVSPAVEHHAKVMFVCLFVCLFVDSLFSCSQCMAKMFFSYSCRWR